MKQQFDLSLWLQDKSRKIVTRDGKLVRIICTDRKARSGNIVGLVGEDESFIYVWQNDGTHSVSGIDANDLFFADEKEGLTEFEKCVQNILNEPHFQDIEAVKQFSKTLLDLARKEISKSLPKWKKAKKNEELDCHVAIQQDDRVVLSDFVQKDEYYITLDALKKLPKEE